MKYEYLKGSEKDFEGAPQWCTHVSRSCIGLLAWEQDAVSKKGNLYQWCDGVTIEGVYEKSGTQFDVIAERQPISESSWDGVGLPPVGCECEYKDQNTGEWHKVSIKYQSEWIIVISGRDLTGEMVEIAKDLVIDVPEFRPIRSEADKKRDSIIEFITGAIDSHGVDPLNSAKFIYDAIAAGKIPGVKLGG